MEILMWTALAVGFILFLIRVFPPILVGILDRVDRMVDAGFGRDGAPDVPTHVIERLARQHRPHRR